MLSKYEVNYLSGLKEELIENFTMKNIETINETGKKNCYTKSLILTPYNSEASEIIYPNLNLQNVYKFSPSVKQFDLRYELNNNALFDNGIINTNNISYRDEDDEGYDTDYNIISSNRDKGENTEKELFINKIITEYIENNVRYKQEYLIKAIKAKEVNYATATYFLLSKDDI